jgi:uncharacterized protein (DUF58 family)
VTFIYKPIYWGYRWSSGLWHWALRRFTPAGLCAAGAWFAAGTAGVDIDNTVLYQSFALLFAFLIFSIAHGFFFRGKFSAKRLLPRFGTAGQPLAYQIQIRNLTPKIQVGLTLLDDLADPRPPFDEWLAFQLAESRRIRPFRMSQRREQNPFRVAKTRAAAIPPVPGNAEVSVTMELTPLRRGILRFHGATIARPDPFGLFRAFRRVAAPQRVLVLPKRYPLPPLALPGALKYQEGGVALASNVGRSEEFVALRDYRQGDPLRHIHWRSWAKAGKPITKEFEDEFFVRHALVLDTFSDSPHSEILEEAVSVAASFACTVISQESLLDLLFIGNKSYCFTAGRSLGQADQMLEILASVKNCLDKKFETLEHLVFNHIAMVSGCICVLQRWDDERQAFVKKLMVLNVPVTVMVILRPGEPKPEAGVMRERPETFHVLEIGKIEQELAKLK